LRPIALTHNQACGYYPLTYNGLNFTWQHGRQLAGVSGNGPDVYLIAGNALTANNLFQYANGNPVINVDPQESLCAGWLETAAMPSEMPQQEL